MEKLFIQSLENEKKRIDKMQGNWGLSQVSRLNRILEDSNVFISENLWDLLIFNVKDLYCNDNKLFITWKSNESKKVLKLIRNNYNLIVEKYNYIMFNDKEALF